MIKKTQLKTEENNNIVQQLAKKQQSGTVQRKSIDGKSPYQSSAGQKPVIQSKQGQQAAYQSQQGQKPTIQAKQQSVVQRKEGDIKEARGDRTVDGEGETPYTINLELPGSGDRFWRSNSKETREASASNRLPGESDTFNRSSTADGSTYTISGPGSEEGNLFGGMMDNGTNSIKKNIAQAQSVLSKEMEKAGGRKVRLIIKAHSRNAVAGSQIATWAKATYPKAYVEYVGFDPVPGPGHKGQDLKHDVESLDQSTVIYSIHTQYPIGFTPQALTGGKRLILSSQKHGGGLMKGYSHGGKEYKGNDITALEGGLYLDRNKEGENSKSLEKLDINSEEDLKKLKEFIPSEWWKIFQKKRYKLLRSVSSTFIDDARGDRGPE